MIDWTNETIFSSLITAASTIEALVITAIVAILLVLSI